MSCFSDHVFFISYLLFCFHFLSYVYSVTKKGISVNTEIPFSRKCRRPESNRHGRLVPQDFKSCASASSATAASMADSPNGAYRARTYDPLLVRQMLSQLSYDPKYSKNKATRMGIEPTTSAVTGRRSNQLSHQAITSRTSGPSGTRTQDRPVMSRLL